MKASENALNWKRVLELVDRVLWVAEMLPEIELFNFSFIT